MKDEIKIELSPYALRELLTSLYVNRPDDFEKYEKKIRHMLNNYKWHRVKRRHHVPPPHIYKIVDVLVMIDDVKKAMLAAQ